MLRRVPIVRCLYEPPWVLAKRAREEMERENAYLRQTAGPTPMLLDGRRYTGATAYLQGRTDVARQSLQPVVRTPGTATPQLEGEEGGRGRGEGPATEAAEAAGVAGAAGQQQEDHSESARTEGGGEAMPTPGGRPPMPVRPLAAAGAAGAAAAGGGGAGCVDDDAEHRPTIATSYELGAAVVREIRVTTPARSTRRPEDDKRALKQ